MVADVIQPDDVVTPASQYVQAMKVPAGERLLISGQIGVRADGSVVDGLAGQFEQAWGNIFAILREAGYAKTDLVKCVIYCTEPGQVSVYREVRDRLLDGHKCTNTYLEISGLAAPDLLCEIEAEAAK